MSRNWNPFKSAFLAFTETQKVALYGRRRTKIQSALNELESMLATQGENRLTATHPQRATYEQHLQTLQQQLNQANQVVEQDPGEAKRQYDGLSQAKSDARTHAANLRPIVEGLPVAWEMRMMGARDAVDEQREVNQSTPGFGTAVREMLSVETQIDQAAEGWDFDVAEGLLGTLTQKVQAVVDIQAKHKLFHDRVGAVRLRVQTVANTDVTGVPSLVQAKSKVASEAQTMEDHGTAGRYAAGLEAMSGAVHNAIVAFDQGKEQAYNTAKRTWEGRWTAIEANTRPEKAVYNTDYTKGTTAWSEGTDAASRSEWVEAARKLLVNLAPAVEALEVAYAEKKKAFDDTVRPLRLRATPALSKSENVEGLATKRSKVVSEASVIDGKENSKLFVAGEALLSDWDDSIKALEEGVTAMEQFEAAVSNARARFGKAHEEYLAVRVVFGTNNPGPIVGQHTAMDLANTTINAEAKSGLYSAAQGRVGDFENKITTVEQTLANLQTSIKNWVKNDKTFDVEDLLTRIGTLETRATDFVDKDGDYGKVIAGRNLARTSIDPLSENYTFAWKAWKDVTALLPGVEKTIRDFEAFKTAYKPVKERYDDLTGKSDAITGLAGVRTLAVNAHKAVTDKRDAGEYVDAKNLLAALTTRLDNLAQAHADYTAYTQANAPVNARVLAAEQVPTPAPVENVPHALAALHVTLTEKKKAVKEKVEAFNFSEASGRLPALDEAASAVLRAGAVVSATSKTERNPTGKLHELQQLEGGDQLLAGVTAKLLETETDVSPALKGALELQFNITLTKTSANSTVTWTATPGDTTAGSLALMYQALHETPHTGAVGPLRVRFNRAKSNTASISAMDSARGDMENAEKDVKAKEDLSQFAAAMDLLPDFEAKIAVVEKWFDQFKAYKAAIKDVDTRHGKALLIAVPSPPYNPKPDIVKKREAMIAAKKLVTDEADAGKYTAAEALVGAWNDAVNAMFVQEALGTVATNVGNAIDKLDGIDPGGPEVLDAFIDGLEKTHPKYNEILVAALKKRFKLDVVGQYDTKTSNTVKTHDETVKHMYDMFRKVPEKAVRDNSALKELKVYVDQDGGASYTHYTDRTLTNWGRVNMYCGRPDTSPDENRNLGTLKAFPDGVNEDYQPENNDDVTYYDWAAIHEVGHAVDWEAQFMNSKMDKVKYGDWHEYANRGAAVAQVVADYLSGSLDFGFNNVAVTGPLTTFVDGLFQGNDPGIPVAPTTGGNPEVKWKAAFGEVKKIKANRAWDICYDGQSSKRAVVHDHVYQEGSGTSWVRYRWSERAKGMTGYQFRAPAEWFAELYAAHYLGKLKPSHPFNAVIKKLT